MPQQTFTANGQEFTASPLSFGQLKQFRGALEAIQTVQNMDDLITKVENLFPMLAASLRKVHQDITPEILENTLDFDTVQMAIKSVLAASGLGTTETKTEGEPAPVA